MFKNFFTDLLFKYELGIQAIAIFTLFCAVSFSIEDGDITWTWSNRPLIALILILLGIGAGLVIIKIKNYQLRVLKDQIAQSQINEELTDNLTSRQHQVLSLIQSGKSNKEIAKELYIEFSTLKTHINNIYKTLGIKTRREAINLKKNPKKRRI